MSKQGTITTEAQLREAARSLWPDSHGLAWRWKGGGNRAGGVDAVGEAILDGRRTQFQIQFRLNPSARDIESLALRKRRQPWLLIAPRISQTLAELCRERGISWADLNGRAWLRARGLLVDRDRSQKARFRAGLTPPDPFSLKSSRLPRALLNRPGYRWTQKELSARTGLSKGLVSRLIQHLVAQGLVTQTDRTLRVQRPGPLLDAWAGQDDWAKRTLVQQYSLLEAEPEEIARRLARLYPGENPPVFTQWFGANLRRPYSIPPAVSAYVPRFPNPRQEKELSARHVPDGGGLWLIVPRDDGVFRETQRVGGFTLACDAQIYLDLLPAGLRGPDQAKALRDWEGFGKPPK